MVTHARCQERAVQYLARAEYDPHLKTHLINAAQAWLLLGLMEHKRNSQRKFPCSNVFSHFSPQPP